MSAFEITYTNNDLREAGFAPVYTASGAIIPMIAGIYEAEQMANASIGRDDSSVAYNKGAAWAYTCAVQAVSGEVVRMTEHACTIFFEHAGRCYKFETSADDFATWYKVVY